MQELVPNAAVEGICVLTKSRQQISEQLLDNLLIWGSCRIQAHCMRVQYKSKLPIPARWKHLCRESVCACQSEIQGQRIQCRVVLSKPLFLSTQQSHCEITHHQHHITKKEVCLCHAVCRSTLWHGSSSSTWATRCHCKVPLTTIRERWSCCSNTAVATQSVCTKGTSRQKVKQYLLKTAAIPRRSPFWHRKLLSPRWTHSLQDMWCCQRHISGNEENCVNWLLHLLLSG